MVSGGEMRDCKLHVVITPTYHRKVFQGRWRRLVGANLWAPCRKRETELVEWHAMPDHAPHRSVHLTTGNFQVLRYQFAILHHLQPQLRVAGQFIRACRCPSRAVHGHLLQRRLQPFHQRKSVVECLYC